MMAFTVDLSYFRRPTRPGRQQMSEKEACEKSCKLGSEKNRSRVDSLRFWGPFRGPVSHVFSRKTVFFSGGLFFFDFYLFFGRGRRQGQGQGLSRLHSDSAI